MNRNINIGSTTYTATSSPNNSELTFYGEIGADCNTHHVLFQPFFGLEVASYWRSSITENSTSNWQLAVDAKSHCAVYTRLGLHLAACKIPHHFMINCDLAWNARATTPDDEITEQFIEFGDAQTVYSVSPSSSSFEYDLTLSNKISKNWLVYLETIGQVWSNANNASVLAGFEFSW